MSSSRPPHHRAAQPPRKPHGRGPGGGGALLGLALLLLAPAFAAWSFAGPPALAYWAGGYFTASLLAYLTYRADKRRAQSRQWRIPESTLHLIELVGGWPGGFLAQQWLRHKSSKLRYQVPFWAIVSLHQYVAIDFLLGWRIASAVRAALLAL